MAHVQRQPRNDKRLFLTTGVLLLLCAPRCHAQVVLTLPSEVTVHSRDIRGSDILTLSRGDDRVLELLRKLDIASLRPTESRLTVRRSFIRIRLMLSGWSDSQFRLNGPETVVIKYREAQAITDSDIELAAAKTMSSVLGTRIDDLKVRLSQPFMQALPSAVQGKHGFTVEVAAPARAAPGAATMTVRLWDGRNLAVTRAGRFEVLKKHRVAVTRVSLQRDMTIDEDDVQFETRFLPTLADEPQEADIYGHRARVNLRAGQLLALRDVTRPLPQISAQVIKSRDKVQVTAVSGPLRIRMRQAQALQAGRVGELISLRNPESGEIISGRVTGPGTVEIRLR